MKEVLSKTDIEEDAVSIQIIITLNFPEQFKPALRQLMAIRIMLAHLVLKFYPILEQQQKMIQNLGHLSYYLAESLSHHQVTIINRSKLPGTSP